MNAYTQTHSNGSSVTRGGGSGPGFTGVGADREDGGDAAARQHAFAARPLGAGTALAAGAPGAPGASGSSGFSGFSGSFGAARDRAAALFPGRPPHQQAPPPGGPPYEPWPGAGSGPPPGPLRRAAEWAYVRCGMDARTVVALAAVLAVALGFGVHHFWTGRPRTIAAPPARRRPPDPGPLEPAARVRPYVSAGAAQVVVDVTGKVRHPGLRRLPTGARVADALTAAGGALPGTDTGALNLARVLVDGEQVVVGPARGPAGALAAGGPGGGSAGAAAGAGAAAAGPVSLNSATLDQLETLPGVGPVLAQRIIDYRVRHGSFTSTDRLGDVPGIGDRRLGELKPLVTP